METKPSAASPKILAPEWRFVAWTFVLLFGLTTLPYVYAYLITPADKQFMGMMLDVPDHIQYFSWMRELTHADLAANKLTPEPNRPIFFNLLWWGMARLGSAFGLGYAGMYQVLRFFATGLFLIVLYRFVARVFADLTRRRFAFLVAVFTSGLGWLLIVLKYTVMDGELIWPLNVYIAEGNTFLSALGYPHFLAAALYIYVFDLILHAEAARSRKAAIFAGLFALFLGWQHAYDLISVYGVLGAYAGFKWLRDRRLPWFLIGNIVIVGALSVWPALYSLWLTTADPLWEQVLAQFANAGVYTPPLYQLPILLGLSFLLAIYTFFRMVPWRLQGVSDDWLLVRAWFLITFFLVYLPVDYQIHLLNGWQVPIAILVTYGLFDYISPWVHARIKRLNRRILAQQTQRAVALILLLAILPTNIYLFFWRFVDLARQDYPYYLHVEEVTALAWLEENVQPDDVVFSSLTIGQYVPAWTGAHAYLAHWAQTADFFTKRADVETFYAGENLAASLNALQTFSVDYIFYGPAERALGEFAPESLPGLERVYASPLVSIYRIPPGSLVAR